MTIAAFTEEAMPGRIPRSHGFRTHFMGEDRIKGEVSDPSRVSPIAYLIEQVPHYTLRAHFHEADQFQIFVTGKGRMGSHAAIPGQGHFVGPFSGYGPIVAGEEGVTYMTLRNSWDPGAQFLPDKIEKIRAKRHGRREVMFDVPAPVDDDAQLATLQETKITTLIETQADGLAASSYLLSPGESATGPDPSVGGGQFWLVMAGEMVGPNERPLKRLSMAFAWPEDTQYVARAGAAGLHVLMLQFPRFRVPAASVDAEAAQSAA